MMTNQEILDLMYTETPINKARRIFSSESARIEQACAQRKSLSPFELRRMEFEAVKKIAIALGVDLDKEDR
jgi:hypothetical protein